MAQLGGYSRDAAVSTVRSFYQFFTALPSLSPSDIIEPPPSGWPEIDTKSLAALKKNNDVIDLLRHLPYLAENVYTQIAYRTNVINYTGRSVKWCIEKDNIVGHIVPFGCELPDYVAVLTEGSRYGSWLLLDTREGTITDYIAMERPERDEPPKGDPDYWRAYKTLPIAEFFESWIENYRTLEWVTVPENDDDGAMLSHTKETDEVREIYRAHGWPSSFHREECKKALVAWDKHREEGILAAAS